MTIEEVKKFYKIDRRLYVASRELTLMVDDFRLSKASRRTCSRLHAKLEKVRSAMLDQIVEAYHTDTTA